MVPSVVDRAINDALAHEGIQIVFLGPAALRRIHLLLHLLLLPFLQLLGERLWQVAMLSVRRLNQALITGNGSEFAVWTGHEQNYAVLLEPLNLLLQYLPV